MRRHLVGGSPCDYPHWTDALRLKDRQQVGLDYAQIGYRTHEPQIAGIPFQRHSLQK